MRLFGLFLLSLFIFSSQASAEVGHAGMPIIRDEGMESHRVERGIAGVKIVSDTGAYAITDEDGKYHFPFLPTGQHVLKIDASTLPQIPGVKREGFIPLEITTESPRKIIVTPGVMTKVSFGVRPQPGSEYIMPEEMGIPSISAAPGKTLLKTMVTQDATKLQPRLSANVRLVLGDSGRRDEGASGENLEFVFDTNYHLFIQKAHLSLWSGETLDGGTPQVIDLPMPLPLTYQIPAPAETVRYQLSVYDAENRVDRTTIGEWKPLKES